MPDWIQKLKDRETEQYFNAKFLSELGNKYVAWVDLMGIQDSLSKDHVTPAILRGELLAVVYTHIDLDLVEVFSVGDGVVLMTDNRDYLEEFLTALFYHYVKFNLRHYRGDEYKWEINLHRLIRAGMGSGRMYEIDVERFHNEHYDGSVFDDSFANTPFGPGAIDAFAAEGGAPFSIRQSTDTDVEPLKWWRNELSDSMREELEQMLTDYFDWFAERDRYRYDPHESEHPRLVQEYFEL